MRMHKIGFVLPTTLLLTFGVALPDVPSFLRWMLKKSMTQFSHRSWGFAQGIDEVNSISQSADGYLWIATIHGLFRFDSANFVSWKDALGAPPLPGIPYVLLAPKTGGLWVGGVGYVSFINGIKSTTYWLRIPSERARVFGLCECHDGTDFGGHILRIVCVYGQGLAENRTRQG